MNGTENCLTNLAKVVLTARKKAVFSCAHSKTYPPLSLSGGGGFFHFVLVDNITIPFTSIVMLSNLNGRGRALPLAFDNKSVIAT